MSAHVSVALGTARFGVSVLNVREVTRVGRIVPVPGTGPMVAGISHAHGEILPVLDLAQLLGVASPDPRRMVVVRDGERCAGLPVDAVSAVGDLAEVAPSSGQLTRGSVSHDGDDLTILDIPAILDAVGRAQ